MTYGAIPSPSLPHPGTGTGALSSPSWSRRSATATPVSVAVTAVPARATRHQRFVIAVPVPGDPARRIVPLPLRHTV